MQDAGEPKKPNAARARKTTPRARPKKAEGKKAVTPRRRASPRNVRKASETEQKEEKKAEDTTAASAVKEEEKQEQKEVVPHVEAVEKSASPQETEELPPAKDTQLRRNYLQRIYRQLQSTHPNQDDGFIRQIATNVEMEACQASTTRSQYVAAMDQEIHKLMQFEMQQANAPSVYANGTQSFDNAPAVSSEMQSGYSQHQMSHSRSLEYAQALAKAQSQDQASNGSRTSSFSTPRQSISGDTSFQSMMNNQNAAYGRNSVQQQQQNTPTRVMNMQNLQQMGSPFYRNSPTAPPTSQAFSQSGVGDMSGQGVPRNMMEAQQQLGSFPMQQQMQHPGPVRSHSRPSTLQEFSAQIQHLDKSVLIELLWNQRNALAQWQRQAKHLELQLSARQNASSMGSPGFHSPYSSPMVGASTFVNPNANMEAEMQRARERNNSRIMQQQMPQYSYPQQSNDGSAGYSQASSNTADWGENPQLYWEKVRLMKASYVEQLRTAQRALAQNTAPPNSLYTVKAQSMMQNIAMVLNILNEQPTNVQPRKFEVLTSIDRFMQMSVTPIVQKVLSSGAVPLMTTSSQAAGMSVSSPAVAASVATYSAGMPPARDNNASLNNNPRHGTSNQYPRWSSPSTVFGGMDNARQPSRGVFADAEVKSSIDNYGGGDSGSAVNAPTQVMNESTSDVNKIPDNANTEYDSTEYAPVSADNEDEIPSQTENSTCQYDAANVTPKESCTPALPTSESRPSSLTDTQLSPGASLSTDENASNSKMQPSNLDDSLNVFSYFPEMDFDDPVPDSSSFVKENNPSNISRKRGIEDV